MFSSFSIPFADRLPLFIDAHTLAVGTFISRPNRREDFVLAE
jgi:hypothetical protein